MQDQGRDTVDANLDLGLPADARDFRAGARILSLLGVGAVRLLTNNPDKVTALTDAGIDVAEVVPLHAGEGRHNVRYLTTKRDRLGHRFDTLATEPPLADDQPMGRAQ